MTKHKLMIKTHNSTGLRYLCYTRKKDHESYTGSGVDWLQHLLQHGFDFSTELLLETEDFEFFKSKAIEFSIQFDVVESSNWANRKIEEGDGGDTVSNKRWITNGSEDRYLTVGLELPEGWRYGRSKCVFNDRNKQREFSAKSDRKKAAIKTKQTWAEGKVKRDNSKLGRKGDANVSKRPEVLAKIKAFASSEVEKAKRSERMKTLWKNGNITHWRKKV